jgi:hypothetical protein
MNSPTFILGQNNWAVSSSSILGYEYGDLSGQFSPIFLTSSRASIATYVDATGLIVTASNNISRIDYSTGTGSLLLEPQRTNVVLWSDDLSQSNWIKTNYTLSNTTAIQGLTATRVTKNSTNNGGYRGTGARNILNSVGTFSAGTKAFSCLIRKGNTAKVGLLINQVLVGASTSVACEFDFATETFTNVSSGLTATFEKPTTDVYRLTLVINDTGTGSSKTLWIAPIDSSNTTVTDGYIDIAYFQWELGAYATTYIPTTNTTTTRLTDTFNRANMVTNGYIGPSGSTWYVELRNNVAYVRDTTNNTIWIGDTSGGASNAILIRNDTLSAIRLRINKNVAGVQTNLFTTTTDTVKLAIKWNGTSADIFQNGVKVVSATAFTTTNMEFLVASGQQVPTFIPSMLLYDYPLPDSELITLTTL